MVWKAEELKQIKRILVITLSNLGDVILTTPVITELRRRWPQAHMSVIVGDKAIDVLRRSSQINELIIYQKTSFLDRIRFVAHLSQSSYDLVIDLRHTLIPFFIGTRHRTSLLRKRVVMPKRQEHLDQLKALELPGDNDPPAFEFYQAEDLLSAREKLHQKGIDEAAGYVVLAPGSRFIHKSWAADRFGELALRIYHEYGKRLVILGASSEQKAADAVIQFAGKACVDFCGQLPIWESAAMIAMSELVICNDSAIMHLAHALSVPCVSLFGPTNPIKYGKHDAMNRVVRLELPCSPCESADCHISEKRKCLKDISVDRVYQEVKKLLISHSRI